MNVYGPSDRSETNCAERVAGGRYRTRSGTYKTASSFLRIYSVSRGGCSREGLFQLENTAAVSPDREELFQKLRKRMVQAAQRWWLPPGAADDVAHEAIVFLLEKCKDKADHELVYIGIKVVSNKVLEWGRRQKRFAPLDGSAPDSEQQHQPEEADFGEREAWQKSGAGPKYKNRVEEKTARRLAVTSVLAGLSTDCQRIIRMRGEGRTHEEIQQELGLSSANAAAARLSYCLKQAISANEPAAPNTPTGRTDQ